MIKIWMAGGNGQIGKALKKVASPVDYELLITDLEEVDVCNLDEVERFAEINRPEIIINSAAVTDIAFCEEHEVEAYRVNALGARNLAIAAKKLDSKFVQMSTDDVFSGRSECAYKEFDEAHPGTVYGKSKLAGEGYVKEFTHKHFIIRSNWVYGEGDNFVQKLIARSEHHDTIPIAADQFGSPTSAVELAKFILFIIETSEYGIYHATCQGTCSRYVFAKKILKLRGITAKLKAVPTRESEFSSVRPAYAVLDNFVLKMLDVYQMPDWETALEAYIREEE